MIKDELQYFLHLVPLAYINDVIIPATNANASAHLQNRSPVSLDELMHVFGFNKWRRSTVSLKEDCISNWHQAMIPMAPTMNSGRFEDVI